MTVLTKEEQIQETKKRLKKLRQNYYEMERGASKEDKLALKVRSMELQMRLDATMNAR